MRQRHVDEGDVARVLMNPSMTWADPEEGSMVLTGRAENGQTLLVWVVGNRWPQAGRVTVKSTAWKDEE